MKKRGVSPLIATVLIIAFVIILFSLVTTWVRRSAIEPGMQISEEKIAFVLDCAELNAKIIKTCKDGNDLKTTIDNIGTKDLYGVKIRAISDNDVKIGDFPNLNLEPLARSDILKIDDIGDATKIEVYPMTATGICQDRLISTTAIAATC